MDVIAITDRTEIRSLLSRFGMDPREIADTHIVRIAIDGGTVKVKFNEHVWSPGYGTPMVKHSVRRTEMADTARQLNERVAAYRATEDDNPLAFHPDNRGFVPAGDEAHHAGNTD